MLRKIKVKFNHTITLASKKSSFIWQLKMLSQLRYKFNALKLGIESNTSGKSVLFNLRRNIHRLEKGLSYPISKEIFAEDYIAETIQFLESVILSKSIDEETFDWAISILTLYFDTIIITPRLVPTKHQFLNISSNLTNRNKIPYESYKRPELSVSYDDLLKLSVRRRSIRYFQDTPVSTNDIRKLYDVAKYAPSACNRQAFQFLYFDDKHIVDQLSSIPGGVAGYSLPSLILILGRYDGYFDVRDINAPLIDSSLSIMSFLYAAETLGLGTVCINWPNLPDREEKLRHVLHIDPAEFVVMMIGIGYPLDNGKVPFSAKRPNESVLLINARVKK